MMHEKSLKIIIFEFCGILLTLLQTPGIHSSSGETLGSQGFKYFLVINVVKIAIK